MLGIIHLIFKKYMSDLEECSGGEEAVTPSLMLNSNTLDPEIIGNVLETSLQGFASFHQVFDVEEGGEEDPEEVKEWRFFRREGICHQHFKQISKVIAGMKSYPLYIWHQH